MRPVSLLALFQYHVLCHTLSPYAPASSARTTVPAMAARTGVPRGAVELDTSSGGGAVISGAKGTTDQVIDGFDRPGVFGCFIEQ